MNFSQMEPHVVPQTAHQAGLFCCHTCMLLVRMPERVAGQDRQNQGHNQEVSLCPRCGTRLYARKPASVARCWALLVTAAVLYIPANVLPIMTVIRFGQGEPNTIWSGIIHLLESGMWPLSLLIFFASMVVPVLKLCVLVFLLLSVQFHWRWRPRKRTRMYHMMEMFGHWSMVDIFLVSILTALVQLDQLTSIEPGIGATYFGAVVILTMLAAKSFDPRLIWDNLGDPSKSATPLSPMTPLNSMTPPNPSTANTGVQPP